MPYYIYRLTSPSGKSYIGVSKNVKNRWHAHCRKARNNAKEGRRHPLYDAINSFGRGSFTINTLASAPDLESALKAEKSTIRLENTITPNGYNVSRGGEYDSGDGGRIFWCGINSDPVARDEYLSRLSEACKKRTNPRPEHLIALNAEKLERMTPREKWKYFYRLRRMSAKAARTPTGAHSDAARAKNSKAVKLAWQRKSPAEKARFAHNRKVAAVQQWASRTGAERVEISNKISVSQQLTYVDENRKELNAAQLSAARDRIDRSVQGPAASKGLKAYWARLKSDPVAYAAMMKKRTESRRAGRAKKNL